MDIYHGWCDLKPGTNDLTFVEGVTRFMEYLRSREMISNWRLTRRKLGFGVPGLGEFHIMMEVKSLAQLEEAFAHVASRREPAESAHFSVNSLVQNAQFALYRDFPDEFRHQGDERF